MAQFKARDMIRIILAVSRNDTGTYVAWRAVNHLSENEMAKAAPQVVIPDEGRLRFRVFLEAFDKFVDKASILEEVPGWGWVLEIVLRLYRYVRENFPI